MTLKVRLQSIILGAVGAGHAPPPIVNVPLVQGKVVATLQWVLPERILDLIPDEDYAPSRPPSPNSDSQHPPDTAQIASGHGGGRFLLCLVTWNGFPSVPSDYVSRPSLSPSGP
ncbi:hypothetical protein F4604DRAFT_8014 [Suillus subluteus]|nr:hypothetical protein F4604DRAFT_567962 [Suillus subluteus]KAG1892107.1 hypothetical protein F4604DRAFT_8014 [Suillus subluteus]